MGSCPRTVSNGIVELWIIEVGKKADLIIWDLDTIDQIPYNIINAPIVNVIKDGVPLITLD